VHPRLAELVAATPEPFLQTIVDIGVSRTVFGRACLLGDAAFVVRPHTAAAAAKAAGDSMSLATAVHRARRNVDAALAGWQES
jgi:2-polyprenyl-6-methoxyphenol hydroxylase-like FAD-dependent oxidoreductase